jgi:hypothetical protein
MVQAPPAYIPGTLCTRQDQWYWQCKPLDWGHVDPPQPDGTPTGSQVLQPWDQCGGQICATAPAGITIQDCVDGPYSGLTCPLGYTCQRETQWYWQCRLPQGPGPAPSGSTPGSTTTGITPSQQGPTGSTPGSTATGITPSQQGPTGTTPGSTTTGITPSQQGPTGISQILGPWQQCGGESCAKAGFDSSILDCRDGPYSGLWCPGGFSCQRGNQWYWQCRPASSGESQVLWPSRLHQSH